MSRTVRVSVPGTTANCGPGFDTLGIACTIYNRLELTLYDDTRCKVDVIGEGESSIPTDDRNIAVKAARMILDKVNSSYRGLSIKMINGIPLARGLGSSAAAIVAGLVAANEATGNRIGRQTLFEMATELEGHPDNVAPAIFGGITVSVLKNRQPYCMHFMPPKEFLMVVAVPEFTLSTHKARQVLPATVPFKDAVYNVGQTALLVGALTSGDYEYLKIAFDDRLHQPYRQSLVPGMKTVFDAALACGAYGATISGAGPCLIAYTDKNADEIGTAMVEAFNKNRIKAKYLILNIDRYGVRIDK